MLTALIFSIISICIALFLGYLLYAKLSKPSKWPFKKTIPKVITTKSNINNSVQALSNINSFNNDSKGFDNDTKGIGIGIIIFIIIFFIFFICIAIAGIYLSIQRYKIAGDAISKGNTGVALAVMAPEIGQGIGSILHGNNYGMHNNDYDLYHNNYRTNY